MIFMSCSPYLSLSLPLSTAALWSKMHLKRIPGIIIIRQAIWYVVASHLHFVQHGILRFLAIQLQRHVN